MGAKLISVRVPADRARRLATLAETTDRTASYVAAPAIEEFLPLQEWQVKAIRQGMADRGREAAGSQGSGEAPQEVAAPWMIWTRQQGKGGHEVPTRFVDQPLPPRTAGRDHAVGTACPPYMVH